MGPLKTVLSLTRHYALAAQVEPVSPCIRTNEEPKDAFGFATSDGCAVPNTEASSTVVHLTGNVARRRPGSAETTWWDDELTGFGLRVQPSGRRSWIVKTVVRGRQVKKTLGRADVMNASEARRQARALLAVVALDGLPEPAKAITGPLFADFAETFWADYARHWKPATQYTNRRALDRDLKPVFGATAVADITRADVMRWRDGLGQRPGIFNRALPVLAVMLAYAEPLGFRAKGSNPCKGTTCYRQRPKERFLSPVEYRRLGRVLTACEGRWPAVVAIVRLLLFTGARYGEIVGLQWDAVQPPRLCLADSKTGPRFIYLNSPAEQVLSGLERKRLDCPWVFPNERGDGPTSIVPKRWHEIRRWAALPDVRLHDLRHSFASVAINDGVPLVMIGRLLGHALPETTARYAHLEDGSVQDAAARVSRSLGEALEIRR